MPAREIRRKAWDYILYETESGLLLVVLCGSVAMFLVGIVLSDQERARYRADEAYLDELAAEIRDAPGAYRDRHVPPP